MNTSPPTVPPSTAPRPNWPEGYVTIVFTDIENSTRITRQLNALTPMSYEEKLRDPHRQRLAQCIGDKGCEVQRAGDGHMWVFQEASEALACLVAFQQWMQREPLQHEGAGVQVRIGMHTSEAYLVPQGDGQSSGQSAWVEYPGTDTNFAARIAALACGGQILLSESARKNAEQAVSGQELIAWPNRYVKDFADDPRSTEPVTVHEVRYAGAPPSREPGFRFFRTFYEVERNRYVPREEKEKEVIAALLGQGQSGRKERLVVIEAPGGMGKTRLAVNCAASLAALFANGVFFIGLTFVLVRTRQAVAEAIASQLGLDESYYSPEALLEFLSARHVLLILDNYESVASPEVGQFLTNLVTHTLKVSLLVTTRQSVRAIDTQWPISIDLGMPRAQAEALFFDRARRASPRFTLDALDPVLFERLLATLVTDPDAKTPGYIPLAIELVAAWMGGPTLLEIVEGLERQPLEKYTGLPREATRADSDETLGRHDSLTNSLQWSYNLLITLPEGEHLQGTFRACGFFAQVSPEVLALVLYGNTEGAPDLSANSEADWDTFIEQMASLAKGVTAPREARERVENDLAILANTSLLTPIEREGRTFYRLHHFTRDFAESQRLEQADAVLLERNFQLYYAALAERHSSINGRNDASHRSWLNAEYNNLLQVWELAYKRKHLSLLGDMLFSLSAYFTLCSSWNELQTMALQAIELNSEMPNRIIQQRAFTTLGHVYSSQGRWKEASELHLQALEISRDLGHRSNEVSALGSLGNIYSSQCEWKEAVESYLQALEIARELEARSTESQVLMSLGIVYHYQGRWRDAIKMHQQSLELAKELGKSADEARTLANLGNVYLSQERWEEATELYLQALEIHRELGDRANEANSLSHLGSVYKAQGHKDKAIEMHQQSLELIRELGLRTRETWVLNNLGNVYESQRRLDEAHKMYQQSLNIARELGQRGEEATALANLASISRLQGQFNTAVETYQRAIKLAQELGDNTTISKILWNLSCTYEQQKNLPEALSAIRQALNRVQTTEDIALTRRCRDRLQFLLLEMGPHGRPLLKFSFYNPSKPPYS